VVANRITPVRLELVAVHLRLDARHHQRVHVGKAPRDE
jgi:hypothetical protein